MTHCIFYCNQHAIVLSYNFFFLLSTNSSFFMLCLSIKSQGWNRCNDDEGKGLRGKRTIRVVNRRHAVLSWRKRATRHYDGRSRWVLIIDAWSIFSFSVMCIYIVCLLAFLKWENCTHYGLMWRALIWGINFNLEENWISLSNLSSYYSFAEDSEPIRSV